MRCILGFVVLTIFVAYTAALCTPDFCNGFCDSQGFPRQGCDYTGQCKCGSKVIGGGGGGGGGSGWCDSFCDRGGYPRGGVDASGKCSCGYKAI